MDIKIVMLALFVLAALIMSSEAGKHKKVVIHVPYKVKKIKHTHTIYKTIHHHHHHGPSHGHGGHGHGHGKKSKSDDVEEQHEHFHHHGDSLGHQTLQHANYIPFRR